MSQTILYATENYEELDNFFISNSYANIFLVCGHSIKLLKIGQYFDSIIQRLNVNIVKFDDFQPNPSYDAVVKGVNLFNESECDVIVAVGGGSAIDVAKCIKLYSNMNHTVNYLQQTIVPNDIPFLVIPTTAGTGSEATRYAVIYKDGVKQSVTDISCIPSMVLFDVTTLKSLPEYQKKATMLDALCHAIEAFWSVNSTEMSQEYSEKAIKMILTNYKSYLNNEDSGNRNMFEAANLAGKAINITQTTAGHAMCYKITSLYGIPHGHAAALCVSKLWQYMIANCDKCIDPRGASFLNGVFINLAKTMGGDSVKCGAIKFDLLLKELDITSPLVKNKTDFDILRKSVNPMRLKNNPVYLTEEIIDNLYHKILREEK